MNIAKKYIFSCLFLTILIAAFFTTYRALDLKFIYIQGVFWKMPIPVIYWGLSLVYAFLYSRYFGVVFRHAFSLIVRPWLLMQLVVFLVDLKIRFLAYNPVNIVYMFYIYSVMTVLFCLSVYAAIDSLKNLRKKRNVLWDYGTIYIFGCAVLMLLFLKNRLLIDITVMVVFAVISWNRDVGAFFNRAVSFINRFFQDRTRFLVMLYVLALFVRFVFSIILIKQTGSDFPIASCDGAGYDENGMIIAKGFSSLWNGSLSFNIFGPYYAYLSIMCPATRIIIHHAHVFIFSNTRGVR